MRRYLLLIVAVILTFAMIPGLAFADEDAAQAADVNKTVEEAAEAAASTDVDKAAETDEDTSQVKDAEDTEVDADANEDAEADADVGQSTQTSDVIESEETEDDSLTANGESSSCVNFISGAAFYKWCRV